jgi:hypothetical protein
MPSEPPDGYVAFVERHLDALRRDAARVVGDERTADELYPLVLTDVAARWRWLHLRHTRLRQPEAGERYLRLAFDRRSQRWRSEQTFPAEIQVWQPDSSAESPRWSSVSFGPAGYRPSSYRPAGYRPSTPEGHIEVRAMATAPAWSSIALRLAAHVTPASRTTIRPIAEAAIAWWHAYEAWRRHRLYAALAVLAFFMMVLIRIQGGDA